MSRVAFDPTADKVTAAVLRLEPVAAPHQRTITLQQTEPEMLKRLQVLLELAMTRKYTLEIRLVNYEAEPDMEAQAQAKKRR